MLFTPAQAAARLQMRESWLRRRAAQRRVACSFLGKHLRFSRVDLEAIVADARRPPAAPRPRIPRGRTRRC
ncbi:helix-turn-helix domain-containing protein [Kibdelosporangium aridum]|uniref:helix-turn-helix domain-containing protein n=1 Tax=Kibdelosporangium aridum TaxID=2030 RepID=UPI0037BFB711